MKWGNNKTFRSLLDLGFRDKLILLFVSLISLPVLIITTRSYLVSSAIIEEKTNQYSHDILYQTTKMVETRLAEIEDISFNVFTNPDVQDMLLAFSRGQPDEYEANRARIRMEAILSSQVLYKNEVMDIYIVSFGRGYKFELNKTKQAYELDGKYLAAIQEQAGGTVWFGGFPSNKAIVLARLINSIQTQKPIGYLVVYVDENYLLELLKNTYSVKGGDIFVINSKGLIVTSNDKERRVTNSCTISLDNEAEAYSFKRQEIDGITQYVACSEPMKNGWRIESTVPVLIYQTEIDGLRNSTILFSIALLAISVLCAF